jgi:hypothetical protein
MYNDKAGKGAMAMGKAGKGGKGAMPAAMPKKGKAGKGKAKTMKMK